MANTRTITAALQKEGLPLELVRAPEGYHYFIWDTLDTGAANRGFETHSIMCPRFGDQTPERWLEDGRAFARELEEKGLWPLEDVTPPPAPRSNSEIAEQDGFAIQPGERAVLDGTVKAHTEYNGAEETQLTRCKIKEAEEKVA